VCTTLQSGTHPEDGGSKFITLQEVLKERTTVLLPPEDAVNVAKIYKQLSRKFFVTLGAGKTFHFVHA
jgi:hypothetical protein